MRLAIGMVLLAVSALAQVQVQWTPLPNAVVNATVGKGRDIGTGKLYVVNDSSWRVVLPPERVYMALPHVKIIPPEMAMAVLTVRRQSTKKEKVLRVVGYSALGALGLTFWNVPPAAVVRGLAATAGVAQYVREDIQKQEINFAPLFADTLKQPITLDPGQGASFTVFNALMKGADTNTGTINLGPTGLTVTMAKP